jgi:hypothetical protein
MSKATKPAYVRLIRNQTGVTFLSSFTQPVTTNNVNTLTRLTVYYSSQCVMGIDFGFSDGTKVSTGSSDGQLKGQTTLDLINKTLYEVDSYCGLTADFIRFCSLSSTGVKTCLDNGVLAKVPSEFICLKNMTIFSFVGNYFSYYGWYCLSNLGVNVLTTEDPIDTSCLVNPLSTTTSMNSK